MATETASITPQIPRPKKMKPLAYIDQTGCTGCEACRAVCPVDCILVIQTTRYSGHNQVCVIDEKRCIGCKLCAFDCPWDTIYMFLPEQKQQYIEGNLPNAKCF